MEPALVPVSCHEYADIPLNAEGRWHGKGHVKFTSGAAFEGSWVNGSMHGKGKMSFPDGIVYEGDFDNNVISGSGTYWWPSGGTFKGQVVAGKRSGTGTMSFAKSAVVYEGQWVNGVRQGRGKLFTNAKRTAFYDGDWHGDMKEGKGVMQYASGERYEGDWEADQKSGRGTMNWPSTHERYEGEWRYNQPNGVGYHVWFMSTADASIPNHAQLLMLNRYRGHFANGKRHGYGVLYYANGSRYEGYWHDDLKQGPGCYMFENGETWVGEFWQDRPMLPDGATAFTPSTTAPQLQIADLLEVEENAAGCTKALTNLLLCFNTELRVLYDMYCQKSSLHLVPGAPRYSSTLTMAQWWDLLGDARLLGLACSLGEVDGEAAKAREAPPALAQFRGQELELARRDGLSSAQASFWSGLMGEAVGAGLHCPTNELTFRSFCEALVRVAAMRYADVPSLERRFSQLLNYHVLHLVPKTKAASASPVSPPPAPLSAWPPEISLDSLQALLAKGSLVALKEHFVSVAVASGVLDASAAAAAVGSDASGLWAAELEVGTLVARIAAGMRAEAQASAAAAASDAAEGDTSAPAAGGEAAGNGDSKGAATAAQQPSLSPVQLVAALCHPYLQRFAYSASDMLSVVQLDAGGAGGEGGGAGPDGASQQQLQQQQSGNAPSVAAAVLMSADAEDAAEAVFMQRMSLCFAEVLEGVLRLAAAHGSLSGEPYSAALARAVAWLKPPPPPPPPAPDAAAEAAASA